jgi:hypothetical protein
MGGDRMTLFPNRTARDIWAEKHCHTCFEPHEADKRLRGKGFGCPIMSMGLAEDRKPKEWDRNARAQTADEMYTCNGYRDRPDSVRRGVAQDETLPLFDEFDERPAPLVPVDGWPDYRGEKRGDHA